MMKIKYLTFPILILKDILIDRKESIISVFDYCFYYECFINDLKHKQASDKIGVEFSNYNEAYGRGEILFNSINIKSPKTSITKNMLFDFYKEDKTEFEVITFLAFAAIKSILQKQLYTKITNQYLISRMSGNSKQDGIISENIEKYSKRYWLDKIKEELQINWGLKLYAQQTRGFYLSFKMNEKDLIKEVELRKYSYRLNELKRRKEKNRKEIMKYLYEKLNPEKKPPTPPEQPPTPPEQL